MKVGERFSLRRSRSEERQTSEAATDRLRLVSQAVATTIQAEEVLGLEPLELATLSRYLSYPLNHALLHPEAHRRFLSPQSNLAQGLSFPIVIRDSLQRTFPYPWMPDRTGTPQENTFDRALFNLAQDSLYQTLESLREMTVSSRGTQEEECDYAAEFLKSVAARVRNPNSDFSDVVPYTVRWRPLPTLRLSEGMELDLAQLHANRTR
jgi:hypothetical protein